MSSRSIITKGVFYEGILRDDVPKSKEKLRPVFEAFTNAHESIKDLRKRADEPVSGKICVEVYLQQGTTVDDYIFEKLIVSDNGIGFDRLNFERLTTYKDFRKGYENKGSGRLQFIHFFKECCFESRVPCGGAFKLRTFSLNWPTREKNSIITLYPSKWGTAEESGTNVTFRGLRKNEDMTFYSKLSAVQLKKELLTQYMLEFCTHRAVLPEIKLVQYVDGKLNDTQWITADDVPHSIYQEAVVLNYSKMTHDGKRIETTGNTETLQLTSFAIPCAELEKNDLKLTSKNEVITGTSVKLECLGSSDKVDGNRYLFFLSGEYLDRKDGNTRGVMNIPTRDDFQKKHKDYLFDEQEILLEDITRVANEKILSIHKEILKRTEEKKKDIKALQEMFLLNPETLKSLPAAAGDTEESILKWVYTTDSKVLAQRDAKIKHQIDQLEELDTTAEDYGDKLRKISGEVVRAIPLQNRAELTHYVARRKLVLKLFGKILERELAVQKQGTRNMDEKLLHNLIFKQSSMRPDESDMWLINEDFVYFEGHSEGRLCDIKVNGKKLFKKEFAKEEEEYLFSAGENRLIKKPDVLLFPDEGKCIILEFKAPNVNVSGHLTQINQYATWIRNYTNDEFDIDTFYGYYIGENITAGDIRAADAQFKQAYHLDYMFCPYKAVADARGERYDGSLYMEAIQYSTLLERAHRRNDIFISKLTNNPPDDDNREQG